MVTTMTEPQDVKIARNAHYVSHGTPIRADYTQAFPSTCRAAMITAVKKDGIVSLAVLNPTGMFFQETVPYDADTPYGPGTWHWPTQCESA